MVRGGAPERLAASAYVMAYCAGVWLTMYKHHAFYHMEWGVLATDLGLALALGALALKANRLWTLWAVSFQIVSISGHFAKLLIPETIAPAYGIILGVWSYAAIALLIAATARHRSRINRFGSDPGWSATYACPG